VSPLRPEHLKFKFCLQVLPASCASRTFSVLTAPGQTICASGPPVFQLGCPPGNPYPTPQNQSIDLIDFSGQSVQIKFVFTLPASAIGPGHFQLDNIELDVDRIDTTPPSVEIQNAPASVNSTAAFPVTFEFSEDVSGFILSDISVDNGAASNFQIVDGNTYTADITPDGNGSITIDVAADVAGNANTAATQVVVLFDADRPSVVIAAPSETRGPFTATFTFSETVTGFVAGEIAVNGGTVSNFPAPVIPIRRRSRRLRVLPSAR